MSRERITLVQGPLVEHCTTISNQFLRGLIPSRMTCIGMTSGELNSNASQGTRQRSHELNYLKCGDLVPPCCSSTRVYAGSPGAGVWGSLGLAVMYCHRKHVARSHARSEAQKRDPHDTRESTTRRCSRTSHGGSDQEFHFQPSEREKISVDFPETTNPPVAKKKSLFLLFFPPLAFVSQIPHLHGNTRTQTKR